MAIERAIYLGQLKFELNHVHLQPRISERDGRDNKVAKIKKMIGTSSKRFYAKGYYC